MVLPVNIIKNIIQLSFKRIALNKTYRSINDRYRGPLLSNLLHHPHRIYIPLHLGLRNGHHSAHSFECLFVHGRVHLLQPRLQRGLHSLSQETSTGGEQWRPIRSGEDKGDKNKGQLIRVLHRYDWTRVPPDVPRTCR